jgi:hypothetical protein
MKFLSLTVRDAHAQWREACESKSIEMTSAHGKLRTLVTRLGIYVSGAGALGLASHAKGFRWP